jgi:excisionase family DNA binding protein
MVTFPDSIHPKYGLTIRFKGRSRVFQYLDYFDITTYSSGWKFNPLDITFNTTEELNQFLYTSGIISYEIEVKESTYDLSSEFGIVNTKKIYEVEENIRKYLLNYKYYSINEVAEMLSFSRPTVYKLVNDKLLKAVRIYGQLRINHLDLMEFIGKEK